jgi:hypothetical protein
MSGGQLKATLSLGVIEDDKQYFVTGRDQRQHKEAARTGWNSLANAINY